MITIEKSYLVVHATALADPSITLGDFFVSLDGGASYKPANQKQNIYTGQPFVVAYIWQCQPVSGYRALCGFTIEVYKGSTLKQTLDYFSRTVPAGGLYSTSEIINFPSGVPEEGDWSLKVMMSGVTLTAS
jgi:hypothetical protein